MLWKLGRIQCSKRPTLTLLHLEPYWVLTILSAVGFKPPLRQSDIYKWSLTGITLGEENEKKRHSSGPTLGDFKSRTWK